MAIRERCNQCNEWYDVPEHDCGGHVPWIASDIHAAMAELGRLKSRMGAMEAKQMQQDGKIDNLDARVVEGDKLRKRLDALETKIGMGDRPVSREDIQNIHDVLDEHLKMILESRPRPGEVKWVGAAPKTDRSRVEEMLKAIRRRGNSTEATAGALGYVESTLRTWKRDMGWK